MAMTSIQDKSAVLAAEAVSELKRMAFYREAPQGDIADALCAGVRPERAYRDLRRLHHFGCDPRSGGTRGDSRERARMGHHPPVRHGRRHTYCGGGVRCRLQSQSNQLGNTWDCAMLADTSQDVTVFSVSAVEWIETMMFCISYVSI